MASGVSSYSRKLAAEVSGLTGEQNIDTNTLAHSAALTQPRTKKLLAGGAEFTLDEVVSISNVLGYTAGGLVTRALKNGAK
jgi:hypothetical protein